MGVWSTRSWSLRQDELRAGGLGSLYPSQAWSMYRIVPLCESVIDFGFGTADSLRTVRKINPAIHYLGVDTDAATVERVSLSHTDERTGFMATDFATVNEAADLTQGWSFVYAHDRPYGAIRALWSCATKFSLFDVRATHLPDDVIDMERSYGEHDGQRVCYPLLSWDRLVRFLSDLNPRPTVEFSTYYFPPSRYVHIGDGIPEPFVASIVLSHEGDGGVYGRVMDSTWRR